MSTTFTVLGLALGVLGTAAAWVGLKMAKGPARDARRNATIDDFMATRQYHKEHIRQIIYTGLKSQLALSADSHLPLLTQPGWILEKPVQLSRAVIEHVEPSGPFSVDAALQVLRAYWPLRANGKRMERYHEG